MYFFVPSLMHLPPLHLPYDPLQSCVSLSFSAMVLPQPQPVVPSVDPNQIAAQQQAFINQHALLMVSGKDRGLGKIYEEKSALV